MDILNQKEQTVNHYKCNNCGNILTFNPTTQKLYCKNCKCHTNIANSPAPPKHRILTKDEHSQDYYTWINSHKVCRCDNCGSSIILNSLDISTTCPYCNTAFALDKSSLPDIVPDAIIPFSFNSTDASLRLQNFAKSKFFVKTIK